MLTATLIYRAITAATFVESLLVYSHLLGATKVIFHHSFIFKIFPEVWRLVTPFFLTDRDLNFIFDLYFSRLLLLCFALLHEMMLPVFLWWKIPKKKKGGLYYAH